MAAASLSYFYEWVSCLLSLSRLQGIETHCIIYFHILKLENNMSNKNKCDSLPRQTEKLSSAGGKDSATGAFLTWGPTSIHFSFPTLKERAVTHGAGCLKTAAPRPNAPTGFQPSLVQVRRTLSKPLCHMCVASAYSQQLGLVTRAFVSSKALLTSTSFQRTPRSSGTLALLTPYSGPWEGEW